MKLLWEEYKDQSSPEAKLVYTLDKIEGNYTYLEFQPASFKNNDLIASYHRPGYENFPELKPLLDFITNQLKQEFKNKNIKWKNEYDN